MRRDVFRTAMPVAAAILAGVWGGTASHAADSHARPVLLDGGVLMVRGTAVEETFTPPRGRIATKLELTADGWIAGGMVVAGEASDLFLMRELGGDRAEVEVPASGGAARRGWATPLVGKGALEGLLWLEGERHDRLSVRAAERTDSGWGRTEEVSSPGPGSQVALSGVVLDDGSWLAVWTLVDAAGDAETVWSVRRGGAWSEPARLHEDNRVHDVQPILTRVEGGALVVWTGFDGGDYRLRRARFDGSSWTASGFFGGRGTDGMTFVPAADPADAAEESVAGPALLYSTVVPPAWSVEQHDARGEVVATGSVARDLHDAGPVLLTFGADGVPTLVWPSFAPEFVEREAVVDLVPVGDGGT